MEFEFFEWDDQKAQSNLEKHGVGFEIVLTLDWARAIVRQDDRFDYPERRWRALHRLEDGERVMVAFTRRNDRYRIISVRRAHAKEERKWLR